MVKASEYFGRIPIWDAEKLQDEEKIGENFVLCKDISPLPVTRLESWQDFQQLIEKRYDNTLIKNLIFRGQRRYDWKLISTLGRAKISNFGINNIERQQLDNFRQAIRGRIQDHSLLKEELSEGEKNEIWSIGQHHGLMTPLLDWSYSAYVALFFAFLEEDTIEESLMPNYYRCVYMLDSEYCKEFIEPSKMHIFEPTKDEYGRLVSQDGLFTISPIDVDIETEIYNSLYKYLKEESRSITPFNIAQHACKIYIKNQDRKNCLQNLDYMNINHKSLFPDLHGSAYSCNSRITDLEYNLLKIPERGGSLLLLPEEKDREYEKIPLYNEIEKIITKILNDSLSEDEIDEIKGIDARTKKEFKERPLKDLAWVPRVKILVRELTREIQGSKKTLIPFYSYESLMRAKIDLTLTEFDLKGLKPIQDKKQYIINKILGKIKNQKNKNKT